MTVAGIIMECNPFHEGHQYILNEARRVTGADRVVVILSGDYVQRGIPAIESKERRTRDVLEGGADLVIELPLPWSVGAARDFAAGAIRLLTDLGVVDHLVFGAAMPDEAAFVRMADLLNHETPQFQSLLRERLASGLSYPAARAEAAAAALGISLPTNGNDLLGIEYVRALNYYDPEHRIAIHPLPRIAADSASQRRAALLASQSQNRTHQETLYLSPDDFSELLYYRLTTATGLHSITTGALTNEADAAAALMAYLGVDRDLAFRIIRLLPDYQDWTSFCSLLKTRNVTYTRISRCLMHILLDLRAADTELLRALPTSGYARVLGFRKDAGDLLSAIRTNGQVPLIMSPRAGIDDPDISPIHRAQLLQNCKASELYDRIAQQNRHGQTRVCEYTKQPVMLLFEQNPAGL